MIKWAIIFFLISVVAGVLGFTNVAAGARPLRGDDGQEVHRRTHRPSGPGGPGGRSRAPGSYLIEMMTSFVVPSSRCARIL